MLAYLCQTPCWFTPSYATYPMHRRRLRLHESLPTTGYSKSVDVNARARLHQGVVLFFVTGLPVAFLLFLFFGPFIAPISFTLVYYSICKQWTSGVQGLLNNGRATDRGVSRHWDRATDFLSIYSDGYEPDGKRIVVDPSGSTTRFWRYHTKNKLKIESNFTCIIFVYYFPPCSVPL